MLPLLTGTALPSWAPDAWGAWDFLTDQAWFAGRSKGRLSSTPGWTFTRASGGYAARQDGTLQWFGSGELRRTDKGVLIEGSRQNLILQSQTFDNVNWQKTNCTITADQTTAPDGTATADLLESTIAGTQLMNSSSITISSSTDYTASIYLKVGPAPGTTRVRIMDGAISDPLSDATIGWTSGVPSITSGSGALTALGNGWYRYVVTFNSGVETNCRLLVYPSNSSTLNKNVYLWGAQLEAASFPSSYIPTTTGAITRAADALSVTGVSGLGYPLTMFAEFERAVDTAVVEGLLRVDDSTGNNRALLYIDAFDLAAILSTSGGAAQSGLTVAGALAVGTRYKMAARFSTNSVQLARNGTLGTEDTSATNPTAPNKIWFGDNAGSAPSYGYLKRAAIFNVAKTDAQLEVMTTTDLPPVFADFDFINNRGVYNGTSYAALSSIPNWTFTRASSAYYTKSDGTLQLFGSGELRIGDRGVFIEGSRQNLCLQSQTFDNASWSKANATVTADQAVAPDGTTTADEVLGSAAGNQVFQTLSLSDSTSYTFSGYVKPKAQNSWVFLRFRDKANVNHYAWFNISTGATGSTSGTVSGLVISALANGWYRCAATFASATGANTPLVMFGGASADASTSGASGDNFYLWGAQLEAASFPSSYIPTTTGAITRAADALSVTGVTGLDYPITLFAEFERGVDTGGTENVFSVSDGTSNEFAGVLVNSSDQVSATQTAGGVGQGTPAVTGAIAVATVTKAAARFGLNSVQVARGGSLATEDTSATAPSAPSIVRFGATGGGTPNTFGYLRRALILSGAASDYHLKQLAPA